MWYSRRVFVLLVKNSKEDGQEYGSTLGSYPEAEFKEKHGAWDSMVELTITSPYLIVDSTVHSPIAESWLVDKVNSGIGLSYRQARLHGWWASTTTLCWSWLYPPVRDLWIRLQLSPQRRRMPMNVSLNGTTESTRKGEGRGGSWTYVFV
jgi:hypothetical protein